MSCAFASSSSTSGPGFRCPTLWTASLGALAPWFHSGSCARVANQQSRQVWFIFVHLQFSWGLRRLEKTWSSPRVRRPLDHACFEVVRIVMIVNITYIKHIYQCIFYHIISYCIYFLFQIRRTFSGSQDAKVAVKLLNVAGALVRRRPPANHLDGFYHQGQGSACGCSSSAGQEFS